MLPTTTVRDIVAGDYRAATVFQKYGLDFCCGGGVPLERSCQKKGVDLDAVLRDLETTLAQPGDDAPDYRTWEADRLVQHIIDTHHTYVRGMIPVIHQHAEKVARVHGGRHPELLLVFERFVRLASELTEHMRKEEMVLFPYLRTLAAARRNEWPAEPSPFGSVRNPIAAMEAEHQSAGEDMSEIDRLTNGYTPPQDACMTYRVLFEELKAFQEDLHLHVHLENNILFPMAATLEGERPEESAAAAPACCRR